MFSPLKNIKSKYSKTILNNNYYSVVSDSTNIKEKLLGLKGNNQGYVYTPYILAEGIPIIFESEECKIKMLRKKRKEKLQKLGWF
jgi:hypothetical protein